MAAKKEKAFEEVLMNHENLIYYLIRKLGIRDPEKEFYQEGVIALWKAFETYEEARGKFSSYAYFRIEKALLTLIRKNNRQSEKDDLVAAEASSDPARTAASLETGFDPYLFHKIKQALSENQMKWFVLYVLEELPLKTIASKEQVSVEAVKSWGKQAKQKIRKIMAKDEYFAR